MNVANDRALTLAGHAFTVEGATGGRSVGMTGGMLNLSISLGDRALADLARALARLEGVRVTSGPAIVSRGDCYLVHCPGFKMVLSMPAHAGDFAQALLSRAIEPALAVTCETASVFARLMSASAGPGQARAREAESAAEQNAWQETRTLRRATLQAGKTLARKTPLVRRTPLARGGRLKP
jgi:hypothetical protein